MSPFADREVVLFDAGGTLVTLDFDRVREVVDDSPVRLSDEVLDRAEARARLWAGEAVRARLSPRELWDGYFGRLLTDAGAPPAAVPSALATLWRINRDVGLWRRPAPGAREVLERVRAAGRRAAVVSNAEGRVEADLTAAGFAELLETVVDSHVVGVAKPDPRIFAICLSRMQARPEQAVYIGDVPAFDVDGARAAGIPPILLDRHDVHRDLAGVTRIRRIEEVLPLLGIDG